ncbi:Transcription activator BRG1 [Armadillidium vulgare]|nr:Transcription activator BRG1 [Armadillidium vulgare]
MSSKKCLLKILCLLTLDNTLADIFSTPELFYLASFIKSFQDQMKFSNNYQMKNLCFKSEQKYSTKAPYRTNLTKGE